MSRLAYLASLALLGCGSQVVQSAELPPEAALECVTPGALGAPAGDETRSPLIGTGYAGSEGPGLFVTARDAYRVYLNGELVVESSEPRAAAFVPLTLLPGRNALTVLVSAQRGTPAALLELDELDNDYGSGSDWKVSSAPGSGFAGADFDDRDWAAAEDYGPSGALPGCDPDGFPSASPAHWIGPAYGTGQTVALRKVITIAPLGYGADAIGGGAAPPVTATSVEALLALAADTEPRVILIPEGSYDFRTAPRAQPVCPSTCTNDTNKPRYTVLSGAQTCASALVDEERTEQVIPIAANKTVVGLGRGAQLRGVSFQISDQTVLRNLAIFDVDYRLFSDHDAVDIGDSKDVWLDHLSMKWISGGFTDVSAGSSNVTLSWLDYDGVTPTECDGQHTRSATLAGSTITVHHCYFDHVQSHAPTVQSSAARAHLFNNVVLDDLGYAVGSNCGAQVLLEGSTFQRVATPTARGTCPDDTLPGKISAPAGSNDYGADVGPHQGPDHLEPRDPVFTPPYDYTVDDADAQWRTVTSRAGAGGPWARPLTLDESSTSN